MVIRALAEAHVIAFLKSYLCFISLTDFEMHIYGSHCVPPYNCPLGTLQTIDRTAVERQRAGRSCKLHYSKTKMGVGGLIAYVLH